MYRVITALSMTVGRGAAARVAVELAGPGANDTVVDVGCGPGAAARSARRAGAAVTGVDPDPLMLGLARVLGGNGIRWLRGSAESLPLPDGSATIVWALSSLHDWGDRKAGIAEAARVLGGGGRFLVLERLVAPGARGHAAHGLTADQAAQLAADLTTAGFGEVSETRRQLGRRTLVAVCARLGP